MRCRDSADWPLLFQIGRTAFGNFTVSVIGVGEPLVWFDV
jgi:hypothetical protein